MIQTIADSFYTDVIIWPDTQYCRKCKVKEKMIILFLCVKLKREIRMYTYIY